MAKIFKRVNSRPSAEASVFIAITRVIPVQVRLAIIAVEIGVRHIAGDSLIAMPVCFNGSHNRRFSIGLLFRLLIDGWALPIREDL